MADIKVLYINATAKNQEHSESADSIKMLSFKTANKELTDAKLGRLVDGADGADEHIHDARYFRENEFINASAGVGDAGKPIKADAGGKIDESFLDIPVVNPLLDHGALLGLVPVAAIAESTTATFSEAGSFYDVDGVGKAIQLFSTTAGHYFWLKVTDGSFTQTDPGLSGSAHQVDILAADTSAQIATKIYTAINSVTGVFSATNAVPSQVIITNTVAGAATDGSASGSAAAVVVGTQGAAAVANDDHTQYLKTDGTRDLTGIQKYAGSYVFVDDKSLVSKKYVDDQVAGLESVSVLDILAAPPGSPSEGAMYLVADTGASGDFAGQENKIATFYNSAWQFRAPTVGLHVYVDDVPSNIYLWSGSAYVVKTYENTTASTGLIKIGSDIRLDSSSAGAGLGFTTGTLSVNVDNATIEIPVDTLRVKADGINDTHIDWGTGTNQVSAVDMPIADAGSYFATDNVEAALQELASEIEKQGVTYKAAVVGVTAGDLVYFSGNKIVSPLNPVTLDAYAVGLALTTQASTEDVVVLADDVLLPGVLTGLGAVAGDQIYWTGTAYSLSIHVGSNKNTWQVGIAANTTDLHIEIRHVKKNS